MNSKTTLKSQVPNHYQKFISPAFVVAFCCSHSLSQRQMFAYFSSKQQATTAFSLTHSSSSAPFIREINCWRQTLFTRNLIASKKQKYQPLPSHAFIFHFARSGKQTWLIRLHLSRFIAVNSRRSVFALQEIMAHNWNSIMQTHISLCSGSICEKLRKNVLVFLVFCFFFFYSRPVTETT